MGGLFILLFRVVCFYVPLAGIWEESETRYSPIDRGPISRRNPINYAGNPPRGAPRSVMREDDPQIAKLSAPGKRPAKFHWQISRPSAKFPRAPGN